MTTAEELVAATAATVNGLGARFYFHPATLAKGKELGLDGFRFYVLGRGGVLGDVEPAVITSAFGYFNPGLVAKMWNSAKQTMNPREAARIHLECNADIGRSALGDVDGLAEFCDAAEQVLTDQNPAGLALYAGIAAEPLPDDLPGRAMHLLAVHRELRGSIHLAVIVASGMHAAVAHALRRPSDVEMFGWPADLAVPADAAEHLAEIDRITDERTADAYESLSDEQRSAFVRGVAAIDAAFAD